MMFRYFLPLILIATCVANAATTQQKTKAHKAKTQAAQTQAPAAVAAPALPPQPPPTPEHGPASPPEVNFQGGQLVITARNSTLSDVLNLVKQKTGAAIDMPPGASERVVGQFGPGPPRDVIAQLLNGSHFDYVLLGSPQDPGALKRVVLTARAVGPEQAPQQVAKGQNLQAVPQVETDQSVEDNSAEIPPDVQPEEEQQQPEQQEQQDQGQQPGQPVIKTPEQLLRELQQQQQQQQNGQQPPAPQER